MIRTLVRTLTLFLLLPAASALAAPRTQLQLELHTQDDDLRAGGAVWFVLRMDDGSEQSQSVVSGTALGGNSSVNFRVGPQAPYDWSRVREFGLRARPHPGDGALLRPDAWKVWVTLHGLSASCAWDGRLPPGEICFGPHDARFDFQREETKWSAFHFVAGRCLADTDCGTSREFCAPRTARCAPSGGDFMGCVALPAPAPACAVGQLCVESSRQCTSAGCAVPDRDGDGVDAIACGGLDCDDEDSNRRPGRTEVCDADGHDEDCERTTVGDHDADHDGFIDAACWNDSAQF